MDEVELNKVEGDHPRLLIPELCRLFYRLGWITGTGGSITIRRRDEIFITPSGVQKELIKPNDIYMVKADGSILEKPLIERNLKISDCTSLFLAVYNMRDAGAVIHTHSMDANMVTMLHSGREIRITNQEMLKGIRRATTHERLRYDETLVVPIIENTPNERGLLDGLKSAMTSYPETSAVLVRRHGFYVWGRTWQEAKTMCECYDYLFQLIVKMKQCSVDITTS